MTAMPTCTPGWSPPSSESRTPPRQAHNARAATTPEEAAPSRDNRPANAPTSAALSITADMRTSATMLKVRYSDASDKGRSARSGRRGGYLFATGGDGFAVAFQRAADAVGAA